MSNFQQRVLVTVPLMLLAASSSYAQATRTWVSGVGDDVNPCSRTAPCKTFAGAISKTAAGGEINVLDPGGFGAVTITKSISIESEGFIAGVLNTGTGIIVNAGPNDVVVLRGLTINGVNTAGTSDGISFIGGKVLKVEDCNISEFGRRGISIAPTTNNVQVFITNTRIQTGLSNGIVVAPGIGTRAQVILDNVAIVENINFGLSAFGGSSVTVRNSTIAHNGLSTGSSNIRADGTSGGATVDLENVLLSGSATGIVSYTGAAVRLSNSSIVQNQIGMSSIGGSILSFGNNRIANSGGNAFTSTLPLQ
jgi:hypothetical protein